MDIPTYLMAKNAGGGKGGLKYVVVEELPTTGEDNTIYLVPKSTSGTNNYYDEYMYINNTWEKIGDTEVDLSSKQDVLVSGTNIKTINNQSILGAGDLTIGGSDLPIYYIEDNSSSNPLVLETAPLGIYVFKPQNFTSNGRFYVYFKAFESSTSELEIVQESNAYYFYTTKLTSGTPNNTKLITIKAEPAITSGKYTKYQKFITKINYSAGIADTTDYIFQPYDVEQPAVASTITAKKTFSVLPESSVTPTTDNQLVNKKYVDDNTGGSYTAGTNIEITNDGVINNTIPYKENATSVTTYKGLVLGDKTTVSNSSVVIGRNITEMGTTTYTVAIGNNVKTPTYMNTSNLTIIGNLAQASEKSVSIGTNAGDMSKQSTISIGHAAKATENNSIMMGSTTTPMNKMFITTSNGVKQMATEDYVDNAISTAITSALGGNY